MGPLHVPLDPPGLWVLWSTPSSIIVLTKQLLRTKYGQKISWVLCKAVALAEVTLRIFVSSSSASHSSNAAGSQLVPHEKLHLSTLQVPTGGLVSIPETRILDWNEQARLRNFLFGTRQPRNRFVTRNGGPAVHSQDGYK
ncbi:hypothetical protein PENSUB_2634 [Penicillium subrubescens]|uniref:Uncharacterized protein n=1 Tax=Penicillium subrubescens TaxID=1316194 RepID=A0A1Q5UH00_9EURO|nr:hypothetical protein PENSUB_2634 [Penicillium subrubescens]